MNRISKSLFLEGRQCSRRAWLRQHGEAEPVTEPAAVLDLRSAQGAEVEELAAGLFPDASDLSKVPQKEAAGETAAHLREGRSVLQGRLEAHGLLAIADIIEVCPDGLFVWEVKASSYREGKWKALFDWDLAFQCLVARTAGHKVLGAGVLLLNAEYVRGRGPVNAEEALVRVDRSAEVRDLEARVEAEVSELRDQLQRPAMPDEAVGARCKAYRAAPGGDRPSDCGHRLPEGVCGGDLPDHWAGDLPGLRGSLALDVRAHPPIRIEDLDLHDPDRSWTALQQRVIQAVQGGQEQIDRAAIAAQLDEIEWPVAYVDFEFDPTMAVPRFPGCQPYDRIPFQWAMCIEQAPGRGLDPPREFLHDSPDDPRLAFARSFLDALPGEGSIVAHHASAETTVLKQLADRLGGDIADQLEATLGRFKDTEKIARAGYYHPDQASSYSIKKLAPALAGIGYEGLQIGNGMVAVAEWRRAIDRATSETEKHGILSALRAYCGRDAELMHRILERLRDLSL